MKSPQQQVCARCGWLFDAGRHERPKDTQYVCHNCLLGVVDLIDRAGLPPFSVNGLVSAVRAGNLGPWMSLHGLTPALLERWTGIGREMWRGAVKEPETLRGIGAGEIVDGMRQVLKIRDLRGCFQGNPQTEG